MFSTNFRPKTKKIVLAAFEKNIKVSDLGLICRLFCEYLLRIKIFFQKSGSVTFLPLSSPNFMQTIRKILRPVSEKTALPTNQPTNQPVINNNTDFIGPGWRRSKNKNVVQYFYNISRIHWRLSTILKTSKKMYEVMFFDM